MLPIKNSHWNWLIYKAKHPGTGRYYFFVDKCLPFGASISCSHYQRFSNALKSIAEYLTGKKLHIANYLDDFLFVDVEEQACNRQVNIFLELCCQINILVSLEKTEWALYRIVFLGILLDGGNLLLCVPLDKRYKALKIINNFLCRNKATIRQVQELTGYLNFLCRAVFPGRSFMRRMYAKVNSKQGKKLKPYHHI